MRTYFRRYGRWIHRLAHRFHLIFARIAFRVFARYLGAGRLRSKTLKVQELRLPAEAAGGGRCPFCRRRRPISTTAPVSHRSPCRRADLEWDHHRSHRSCRGAPRHRHRRDHHQTVCTKERHYRGDDNTTFSSLPVEDQSAGNETLSRAAFPFWDVLSFAPPKALPASKLKGLLSRRWWIEVNAF